ncbi:hypothetical protein ABIC21_003683 [Pseudarthrobacter sp. PvP090]
MECPEKCPEAKFATPKVPGDGQRRVALVKMILGKLNETPCVRVAAMTAALLTLRVLTSCGVMKTGGSGTAVPTPSSASSLPDSSTSPLTETCAGYLPSSPCTTYTGISGTTDSKYLPWVAAGGIKAQLNSANGQRLLTVTTRCGPLGGPATASGSTLTVRDIATGAMRCIGEGGDQRLWVLAFLKRPIEQSFSQSTLTWKSGTDTLSKSEWIPTRQGWMRPAAHSNFA